MPITTIEIAATEQVPDSLIKNEFNVEPTLVRQGLSCFEFMNLGFWSVLVPITECRRDGLVKDQLYGDNHAHLIANRLPPVPKAIAAEVLKYLQEVHRAIKTESVVILMYHEELGYRVFVPLQIGASPGAVTHIAPLRSEVLPEQIATTEADVISIYRITQQEYNSLLKLGYKPAGTIHSHPTFKASASSIDDEDERQTNGLHLTFGHVDKPVFEVHGRLTINKWKFDDLDHELMLDASCEEIAAAAAQIVIEDSLVKRCFEATQVPVTRKCVRTTYQANKFWNPNRSTDDYDFDLSWLNDLEDFETEHTLADLDIIDLDDRVTLRSAESGALISIDEEDFYENYQLFRNWDRVEIEPKDF